MDIHRIRCEWGGSPVEGPGLSTFYAVDSPALLTPKLVLFFEAIKLQLPPGATIRVPNDGDTLEATTGTLTGVWSSTGGGTSTSTETGVYAKGVGARITWNTDLVENGRRVRGATYIVPLLAGAYQADGTIATSSLNAIQAAADALVTGMAGDLAVWHRPGPKGAGVPAVVVSATVKDQVSWLRSRRT